MKVVMKDPSYKKLDHNTKRCIDLGIKKLQQRIDSYLVQERQINQVFNDDTLIHDIICGFYVYKCRANNNQLRLLYTMNNNKLIIISHFIKSNRFVLTVWGCHDIIRAVFSPMGVIRFRRDTWRSDRASRMSVGLVNHPAKP